MLARVLLLIALLSCLVEVCRGDDLLPKCEATLSACDAALTAEKDANAKLQAQVVVLKDSEGRWKKEARSVSEPSVVLTSVLAGTLGGALGGYVAEPTGGLAKGGMVGALVGLAFGLILGGGR